jgi:hypothetical protein
VIRWWRDRVVLLWTTRGRLAVRVCPYCGALVVTDGRRQHEQMHEVMLRER